VIYVIGAPCTDDRSCVDECPADAIYLSSEQAVIHPGECIGCGACVHVCPSGAIKPANALPADWEPYRDGAARVFAELGPTEGGSLMSEPVPDPVGDHVKA
jgi:NAD-dependent dihydropyrimidine dehydrogenase PreA subunit